MQPSRAARSYDHCFIVTEEGLGEAGGPNAGSGCVSAAHAQQREMQRTNPAPADRHQSNSRFESAAAGSERAEGAQSPPAILREFGISRCVTFRSRLATTPPRHPLGDRWSARVIWGNLGLKESLALQILREVPTGAGGVNRGTLLAVGGALLPTIIQKCSRWTDPHSTLIAESGRRSPSSVAKRWRTAGPADDPVAVTRRPQ